jgi:hypothetical protein|nr:MAG TPA: hypothetical protein [Bacteriophage sp.]
MNLDNMIIAGRMAAKLRDLAATIDNTEEMIGGQLHWVGVRDRHDVDGDQLGDSPEASMVRVHARAALGALGHLSVSLENLAELIDPNVDED